MTRLFAKIKKQKKGFTIIETLVAITLLTISVTGPLALAAKGLAYSNYVRDEITAFYLANEGIDAVRNLRDTYTRTGGTTNWIGQTKDASGNVVTSGLDRCDRGEGCYFDVWDTPTNLRTSFDNSNPQSSVPTDYTMHVLDCRENGEFYGKNFESLKTNSWYQDCVDSASKYSRSVKITTLGDTANVNEIKVDSVVRWFSGGIERNITISENLFNIQ